LNKARARGKKSKKSRKSDEGNIERCRNESKGAGESRASTKNRKKVDVFVLSRNKSSGEKLGGSERRFRGLGEKKRKKL